MTQSKLNAESSPKSLPQNSPKNLQILEEQWLKYPLETYTTIEQQACKSDFLKAMAPYVEGVVKSMARRQSDPVEDLVQMGNIGILKALDHYQPDKGGSFKSYASYYVTGEIRKYLREQSLLFKAPRALQELYFRLQSTRKAFRLKQGRVPDEHELLQALGCPSETLADLRHLERRSATFSFESLYEWDSEPEQTELAEPFDAFAQDEWPNDLTPYRYLQDEGGMPETESKLMVTLAIKKLDPTLRAVITQTFYEEASQQQIALNSGVSQMQVSRRLKKALQQLDTYLA
jgi:RNA polymerase sigma-B factor